MNAIQNILEGTKVLASQRAETLAEAQAQMKLEKDAMNAGQDTPPAEVTPDAMEAMTPEQMQETLLVLSNAVMALTERLDGGNK